MLLKDDKKGLVTIIMKKMKGHGDMSPSFASSQESMEEKNTKDGAETDYEQGYEACCSDMISAFKEGDSSKLKRSLKSFISMVLDEEDSED